VVWLTLQSILPAYVALIQALQVGS
jgi:hypothetical protein